MLQTVCGTSPFKYFSICSTNNNSRFQVYLVLIGPYLNWWKRGRASSQTSRHEENMEFYNYLLFIPLWLNQFAIMKKSAKNCTLYHVVNKSVWADIGAASTSSTNRRRHTDILQLKKFLGFFNCLQRQYIGANWFAAPIYIGTVQGESKCLQHHAYSVKRCLFHSAGVSGSGNRIIPRWRPN